MITQILLCIAFYALAGLIELPRLIRHRDWTALVAFGLLSTAGAALLIAYSLGFQPEAILQPILEWGTQFLDKVGLGLPS